VQEKGVRVWFFQDLGMRVRYYPKLDSSLPAVVVDAAVIEFGLLLLVDLVGVGPILIEVEKTEFGGSSLVFIIEVERTVSA
jgi:hypothetical protein